MIQIQLSYVTEHAGLSTNRPKTLQKGLFMIWLFFFSGGGGGAADQSLRGSGAVVRASQLVCSKLSAVLITRCTGVESLQA